ncbi:MULTISPECIES: MarR family winged helix-turn-helix transcriptional regulator [Pseudovibrio]|uniref:MarR family winged helix-turn-helix transcriptional regulator n=1 Tax=Stappiaceae TaxID=2821832 RepID=UPI002367236E|nr:MULTISPECIES: MarR family winged helix-turn-helix transcriptional regulator [Pseudovibrio]MDD7911616.1 MarR family winged helix-turn-helix transcriptional regulator [Pseudovibrio exalbescens]MDX5594352.1 MarR family winged helix-turn-helix transcriptional regulator [Pseudovibrio sp. SPO723]
MEYRTEGTSDEIYSQLLALAWHFSTQCTAAPELPGLSFVEFLTLRGIQQAPSCPTQAICHTVGVSKSGASRIVKRLEQRGFLKVAPDEVDARIKRLELTQLGQDSVDTISRYQSDRLAKIMKSLPIEFAGHFSQNLHMVVDAIEQQKTTELA